MMIIVATNYLIGIDEVGRGPLAGPITVGAVAAKGSTKFLRGIKDSKKLSPRQREEWLRKIKTWNLKHGTLSMVTASIEAATIDKIGIAAAARLAVMRCLQKLITDHGLPAKYLKILLDGGLYAPAVYQHQKTIIKGDEKIPIIAAASIVAKVTRDRKMKKLHTKFPIYQFDLHKGYGTKLHQAAIREHGLSVLHRRTFCAKLI